ncbi:hypothetical protein K491DRAFT_689796 [Lophiostoma macrostomum CBS 122681]|uniref:Uncharacterized protein n=1 Tax=Lophiostoma macrostomum CBS 122681 TaxID=1314788 RepID=A0A6A6TJE8_9PLEO|nr:hypothetical protein K491DRAFT_689796 [Lophiostoma macrostomum CBS 122681]
MASPEPLPATTDADNLIGTQEVDMDGPQDSQYSMFGTPIPDSQAAGLAAINDPQPVLEEVDSQSITSAHEPSAVTEDIDANAQVPTRIGSPEQEAETVDPNQEELDIRDSIENVPIEETSAPSQPQEDTQTTDAQPDAQTRDDSPIFEPEESVDRAMAINRAAAQAREDMPPPRVPSHAPRRNPNVHLFAKIRQVQKQKAMSRAAANRPAANANSLLRSTPDQETYLQSILEPRPAQSVHKPVEAVDDDDEADRKGALEYRRLKKHYEDIKRVRGSLTFKQDIEWMRVQKDEDARKQKRKRDLLKAQEEDVEIGLFPEDIQSRVEEDDEADSEHEAQNGPRKRRKPEPPRKKVTHQSLADLELQSMMVQLEADGDLPAKKRKSHVDTAGSQSSTGASSRKPNAPKTKSKTSKSAKATGTKAGKAPRKLAKQTRALQQAADQVGSLFRSNVFEDQAAEDAADQPTFTSTNKKNALKELIASLPDQKEARSEMAVLAAATRDFDGRGSAKADGNGMWLIKGMKTSLKGYQLLGSAFMRRRENAPEEPRGGLLADQMGLGKTLMMLANIMNGRPSPAQIKNGQPKTTLLVASPSLLTQWGKEIETHSNGLQVMRYGAGNRLDSNRTFDILKSHDVILTTYTEVMHSYPKNEPPIECQTAEQKIVWWKEVYNKERGVLHRMEFYRIVLDEAQAIKNHSSRTSIACRALMAQHKWALSGTPIMNSLQELYPYFKFLSIPHTGSFRIFKNNYCDASNPENAERLLVRLSQFMIRRTHADKMFGVPILKLPKASQVTHWCEFNPVERNIYDIVQRRFAKTINMWAKKGTLEKSYGNALVMLLRLRQLAAHVLMLQFVMKDLLELEDIERIRQVLLDHDHDASNGRTIIAVRKQLEELSMAGKKRGDEQNEQEHERSSAEDEEAEEDRDDDALESPNNHIGGRGASGRKFGKSYNFKPYFDSLTTGESWEKVKEKAKCSACAEAPRGVQLFLSTCDHLYCADCYQVQMLQAAEEGEEKSTCLVCGTKFHHAHPVELGEDESQDGRETRSSAKKKTRVRIERENIKEDWLAIGGNGVLPSAKTIAIKAQILNWFQQIPGVKIIIYTQFLAMIRILAKACEEEGWANEQYHGSMSFGSRDKALGRFADNPNVNILLASLRCGGLGLNLTMASRVILIDPWWNAASEQQAFCRVFRIGQTEPTSMTRFCVKNTVDQRLIEMQERKKKEIDKVMADDGSTVKKLGIKDLLRLFGPITEDSEGRPYIMVDNPDPVGGFHADKDHEGFADEA